MSVKRKILSINKERIKTIKVNFLTICNLSGMRNKFLINKHYFTCFGDILIENKSFKTLK